MEYTHAKEFLNNIDSKVPTNTYQLNNIKNDKLKMDNAKLIAMLGTIFESYDKMKNSQEKDIFVVLSTVANMRKVWNTYKIEVN